MVALSFLPKLSAVAANVALLELAPMATAAGTETSGMLQPTPTVTPPDPAGALRLTAQVDDPAGFSAFGLHVSEEIVMVWTTSTVAPVPELVILSPAAEAAKVFVTVTAADVAFAVSVTFTVATTPFAMVLALLPTAMQTIPAPFVPHVMLFPAAVTAAPGVTDKEATPVEYPRLH